MDAAHQLGIRIPQDLSIVGFDNIPEATQMNPKLTTVDQSIQEMGSLAVRLIIDILRGEEPEHSVWKVPTRLIIRESCQSIADHNALPNSV